MKFNWIRRLLGYEYNIIIQALARIEWRQVQIMSQIEDLNNAVARVATDIQTVITDLQNHPAAPDLSDPIAKLTAAADALESATAGPATTPSAGQ